MMTSHFPPLPLGMMMIGADQKGVPEKYVKIIQDMYDRVQTHVWCSVGETEKFPVKVGLH